VCCAELRPLSPTCEAWRALVHLATARRVAAGRQVVADPDALAVRSREARLVLQWTIGERQGRGHAMIVRIWHGRTRRDRADAYAAFLTQRAISDYRSVQGNVDVSILRQDEREVSHFLTITHWISEDAIRAFAGRDILKAKYYPEDKDFLLEFELEVQHFEVVASAP
jgi:heme-degrading monooxygenase HmoA